MEVWMDHRSRWKFIMKNAYAQTKPSKNLRNSQIISDTPVFLETISFEIFILLTFCNFWRFLWILVFNILFWFWNRAGFLAFIFIIIHHNLIISHRLLLAISRILLFLLIFIIESMLTIHPVGNYFVHWIDFMFQNFFLIDLFL